MGEKTNIFFQENIGKEHRNISSYMKIMLKICHCMATQAVGRLCWNEGVCVEGWTRTVCPI